MACWLIIGRLGTAVSSRPARFDYSSRSWWPALYPDDGLYRVFSTAYWAGAAVLAIGFLVLLRRRIHRSAHLDRWVLVPLRLTLAAVVGIIAVRIPWRLFVPSDTTPALLVAATTVGLLLVPLGFLVSAARRRAGRIAVADLVLRIADLGSADQLRDALRDTLRDPDLEVRYWLPELRGYVDTGGTAVDLSRPVAGRIVREVSADDATPLAVVIVDAALARYPQMLDSALAVSRIALENGRLAATVKVQLDQIRTARSQLAAAGYAERRRIERDLHDGVQQRLVALTMRLAGAQAGAPGPRLLEQTRAELHTALRELRDLAHGVHPAALTDGGLGSAVADLAERMPFTVAVEVPDERWPPVVEATAYFVIAEALTNTMKHAGAAEAAVRVHVTGIGRLHIEVRDDGRGGADPRVGTGLAGVRDRVRMLGGELTVDGTGGTRLTAEIPLE
jgi:signal transduction histidine kinase